jgi:DNA-binding response OmpR family regulator
MGKKRILVVEDELELIKAMQIRLEQAGYEVLIASDGQQALDKIHKEKVDLIILDLMIPKIDGYKVCRLLKFDKKYKQIPIIMLSARAQESDIKLSTEVYADAYIIKPFDHKVVISKIKELLKEK